jgi:hypothetical protein
LQDITGTALDFAKGYKEEEEEEEEELIGGGGGV